MAETTIICCAPQLRIHCAWSATGPIAIRRSWSPSTWSPSSIGSVKLPEDYFTKNKVVALPLKFGMGHPVDGHPVSDLMDPAVPGKVMTPMNC